MTCVSRKLDFVQADSLLYRESALLNRKNKESWSTDIRIHYTVRDINKIESKETSIHSATAVSTKKIVQGFNSLSSDQS